MKTKLDDDYKKSITKHIERLVGKVKTEITEDTALYDIGMDSLDVMELAMYIEDEYHVSFNDEDIKEWVTISNVHKSLEELL